MADKEVQMSKENAVSAVSGGKKLTTSSKTPIAKPGPLNASTSTTSSTGINMASKEAKNPSMRELVDILRELNSSLNAQSERIDKHNQSIDFLMSQWNDRSNYADDFQYDDSECLHQSEADQLYPELDDQESVVEPLESSIFLQTKSVTKKEMNKCMAEM